MPTVKNHSTGATAQCAVGSSFREVAQTAGLDIAFACESGICSTCLIQIKSGAENLGPKTEQEEFTLEVRGVDAGDMTTRLGCQCTVNGDVEFEQ
ncbi:MAG: 2Fe-2S iron-sulfur cluster-binding protein [Candidatus Gracilibacteria bacterium]|jgi:ferredoxin